ncbi:MAG: YeeE/YedE thiosulfate transporter family protein [Vicinamibacteria bacterium]
MIAPFAEVQAFTEATRQGIGVAIGLAFGFALERAGLGSARKLVGQFHLTDLTVFKVMFSAIVTAMLGVFWLGFFGVLDLSRVYVPETFLWPQLVGGLVFGVGFAAGGLCPGTACVAAATGRLDGFAAVVRVFAGVLVAGLTLERAPAFYDAAARGPQTLSEITGLPDGVLIFIVVGVALLGFAVAEAVERKAHA